MIGTVLFDLDGTLTDSAPGIVASYRHTLEVFGITGEDEQIRRWIGPPLGESLAGLGIARPDVEAAVIEYRDYFGRVGLYENRLYDGVAEMLDGLAAAGLTLGLATSKLTPFAETILDLFGIRKRFGVISGATADGSRVTKEQIVGHALDSLGRPDPRTVVVVGDREHDVIAAREHGLQSVGVTWGYGSPAELTAAGAGRLAASPAELTSSLLADTRL